MSLTTVCIGSRPTSSPCISLCGNLAEVLRLLETRAQRRLAHLDIDICDDTASVAMPAEPCAAVVLRTSVISVSSAPLWFVTWLRKCVDRDQLLRCVVLRHIYASASADVVVQAIQEWCSMLDESGVLVVDTRDPLLVSTLMKCILCRPVVVNGCLVGARRNCMACVVDLRTIGKHKMLEAFDEERDCPNVFYWRALREIDVAVMLWQTPRQQHQRHCHAPLYHSLASEDGEKSPARSPEQETRSEDDPRHESSCRVWLE